MWQMRWRGPAGAAVCAIAAVCMVVHAACVSFPGGPAACVGPGLCPSSLPGNLGPSVSSPPQQATLAVSREERAALLDQKALLESALSAAHRQREVVESQADQLQAEHGKMMRERASMQHQVRARKTWARRMCGCRVGLFLPCSWCQAGCSRAATSSSAHTPDPTRRVVPGLP